jgi:hypothetical protein
VTAKRAVVLSCAVALACDPSTGAVSGDFFEARDGKVTRMAGEDLYLIRKADTVSTLIARGCDNLRDATASDRVEKQRLDSLWMAQIGLIAGRQYNLQVIVRAKSLATAANEFKPRSTVRSG